MVRPRISPNEKILSRSARSKYVIQSRRAIHSIPGYDHIPSWINGLFVNHDTETRKAIVNAVSRYADKHGEVPTVPMLTNKHNHILDGLIDYDNPYLEKE